MYIYYTYLLPLNIHLLIYMHIYIHTYIYTTGIQGIAGLEPSALSTNLEPLFKEITKLPKIICNVEKPLQLLIANVDYDEFKGKMGIGRIVNGKSEGGRVRIMTDETCHIYTSTVWRVYGI